MGTSTVDVKGLSIVNTGAPKFVFLNERGAKAENIKADAEQEDEFADLYKKFHVPDLSGQERAYINRF